jgi:hypothetical protein
MITLAVQVKGGQLVSKQYSAETTIGQIKAEFGVAGYTAVLNGDSVSDSDAVSEGLLILTAATKGA